MTPNPIQIKPTPNMLEELGKFVLKSFASVGKDISKDIKTITSDIKKELGGVKKDLSNEVKNLSKSNDDTKSKIDDITENISNDIRKISKSNDDTKSKVDSVSSDIKYTSTKTNVFLKDKLSKINTSFNESADRGDKIINDLYASTSLMREKFFAMNQSITKKLSILKGSLMSSLTSLSNLSFKDIIGKMTKMVTNVIMNPLVWSMIGGVLLSAIGLNPAMLIKWGDTIGKISGYITTFAKENFGDKITKIKTLFSDVIQKIRTFLDKGLTDSITKAKSFISTVGQSEKTSKLATMTTKISTAVKTSKVGVMATKTGAMATKVGKPIVDVAMSVVRMLGNLFKGGGQLLTLVKPVMPLFTKILKGIPVFGQIFTIGKSLWDGYQSVFGDGADVNSSLGEKIWTFTKTALGSFLSSFTEIPSAIGDIFGFIFGKDHPVAKTMSRVGDAITGFLDGAIGNLFKWAENLFSMGQNVGGMLGAMFEGNWTEVGTHFKAFLKTGWDSIKLAVDTLIMSPIKLVEDMFDIKILDPVIQGFKAVGNWFSTSWTNITSWVSTTWDNFTGFFTNTWNSLVSKANDIKNTVLTIIDPLMGNFKSIANIFSTFWTSLKENGSGLVSDILEGNWTGVKDKFWNMIGSFSTVVTDLKQSVTDLFTNISTQQWYIDFIQPVVDIVKPIIDNVKSNIKPILDLFDKIVGSGKGIVSSIFNGNLEGVMTHGKEMFSSFLNIPKEILNSVSGIFTNITEQKWFKDYIVSPLAGIGDWIMNKVTMIKDAVILYIDSKIGDIYKIDGVDEAKGREKEREKVALEEKKKKENSPEGRRLKLEKEKEILIEERKSLSSQIEKLTIDKNNATDDIRSSWLGGKTKEDKQEKIQVEIDKLAKILKSKEVDSFNNRQKTKGPVKSTAISDTKSVEEPVVKATAISDTKSVEEPVVKATAISDTKSVEEPVVKATAISAKDFDVMSGSMQNQSSEFVYNEDGSETEILRDGAGKEVARTIHNKQEKVKAKQPVKATSDTGRLITKLESLYFGKKTELFSSLTPLRKELKNLYDGKMSFSSEEEEEKMEDMIESKMNVIYGKLDLYGDYKYSNKIPPKGEMEKTLKALNVEIPSLQKGGITADTPNDIPATLHKNEAVVSDLESPRGDEWVDKIATKIMEKMGVDTSGEDGSNAEVFGAIISMLQQIISGQSGIQGAISGINTTNKNKLENDALSFHNLSNRILGI